MLALVASGWVLLPFPRRPTGWEEIVWTLGFGAGFVTVGAVLVDRRPREPVSRITLGIGLAVVVAVVLRAGSTWIDARPGPTPPAAAVAAAVAQFIQTTVFLVAAPFLLVRFPSGRDPGRLTAVADGLMALLLAGAALEVVRPGPLELAWLAGVDNPIGIPAIADLIAATASAMFITYGATLSVAIVVVARRYRRAGPVVRAQIRWVAVGAGLPFLLFVSMFAFPDAAWLWTAWLLTTAVLPASIGVAILRYHLVEIDRISGRSISWAVITAILAAVFVLVNLGLQAALAGAIGGNTLTTAAATLAVAALFQPLRRRVQAVVDRRFNRGRVDADRLVERFATQARDHVNLDLLRGAMTTAVDEAVAPSLSAMWLRGER
jgi:hypothetical protein